MTSLPRHPAMRLGPMALVASIVAGCVASSPPSAAPSTPTAASTSPASFPSLPTVTPTSTPPVTCADRTLASLTEPQRIGQLFMVGLKKDRLDASERAAIVKDHFGSAWFTAKTALGVAAVRSVADAVQGLATPEATGGVGFFVAANQEGGLIQALSGPGFNTIPSALKQGTWSPSVLETKAARWGHQLRDAGINLDFAPVADVVPPGTDAQNAPIGQLKREFGHDPVTVSSHVAAFIAGMEEAGVATTAKHFPGLGRVAANTDFTAAVSDSVTTRNDPYLEPFAQAVESGVPFVMVSLATYERIDPEHLAAFSPAVMGGMLREDLGYRGIVISDSLTAEAVTSIARATRAVDFLEAGGDMIVVHGASAAAEMAQALASLAAEQASFRARVDDAALRVLQAKEAAGLLPCG